MNSIRALIKKETAFAGESNQLLLLLRYLLLTLIPYTIAVAVVSFFYSLYPYMIASIVFCGLFIVGFLGSYRVRPPRIRIFTVVLLFVYAWLFTVWFGWRISFQLLIFVAFFIFWYDISISIRRKMLLSGLAAVIFSLACANAPFGSVVLDPGTPGFYFMTYTNIIYAIACTSVVAAFFCTQYAEAERQLYLYNKKLKKISETDPLTGLPNRRFMMDELTEIETSYESEGRLVSVAIGDIDFFKKVNDNFGHDAGDYVLSTLGKILSEFMTNHGSVARWGGEEFLFVFNHGNGDEAFVELEKLRDLIERSSFVYEEHTIPITMTFGLEEFSPQAGTDATISAADKKLYLGKDSGRNRVVY